MSPQLITAALHPEYLVTPEGDLSHKTPRGPGTPSSAPPRARGGPWQTFTSGPGAHRATRGHQGSVPSPRVQEQLWVGGAAII